VVHGRFHRDSFAASALAVPAAFSGHSEGYRRQTLVGPDTGAVHTGFAACSLDGEGGMDDHVHSFEESFFVLTGSPRLQLNGRSVQLGPGACGLVGVGVPHAWSNGSEPALWLEMQAPRPRAGDEPADTFFVQSEAACSPEAAEPLDVRDPRSRNFFLYGDGQMELDQLKLGSQLDAPAVSASMATALLAYSGIAVKMLVDSRLGAQLSTMFMVEYQPGGVAHPHDHPLEETYYVLEGTVEAEANGERFTLREGDLLWTGVGCVHAFYNTSGQTVRWLETQSPQPPAQHSYRFNRDWDYLAERAPSPAAKGAGS
jgi:quercetin dioxygenase-like cupin family protein